MTHCNLFCYMFSFREFATTACVLKPCGYQSAAVCGWKLVLTSTNEKQLVSVQHGFKHSTEGSETVQKDLKAIGKEIVCCLRCDRDWFRMGFDRQLLPPLSSTAYHHWIFWWYTVPDRTGLLSPWMLLKNTWSHIITWLQQCMWQESTGRQWV